MTTVSEIFLPFYLCTTFLILLILTLITVTLNSLEILLQQLKHKKPNLTKTEKSKKFLVTEKKTNKLTKKNKQKNVVFLIIPCIK